MAVQRARMVAVVAVLCMLLIGQASFSYVIRPGDTLGAIAQRFGVTVARLAQANGISNVNLILAGQAIVVPSPPQPPVAAPAARVAPASPSLPAGLRTASWRLGLVPYFQAASSEAGVSPALVEAVAWQESGWQERVVSSGGAIGIGQLTPATVAFVNQVLLGTNLDPTVPADNIRMTAWYLAYLLAQTNGDVNLAVAAYNQGLASVRRFGLFPSTARYVADVMSLAAQF